MKGSHNQTLMRSWKSCTAYKTYYKNFLHIATAPYGTWYLICKSEHTAELHSGSVWHSYCGQRFSWIFSCISLLFLLTGYRRMMKTRCHQATWVLCLGPRYCAPLCLPTCRWWLCWRPVTRLHLLSSSLYTMTGFLVFSKFPVHLLLHQPLKHLFQKLLPELPVPLRGNMKPLPERATSL